MRNGLSERVGGARLTVRDRLLSSKRKLVLGMAAYVSVIGSLGLLLMLRWFWSKIERQAGMSLADVFNQRPWAWTVSALVGFCWLALCGGVLGLLIWRLAERERRKTMGLLQPSK